MADDFFMRRAFAVVGLAGVLGLAACSSSSGGGIDGDVTGDPAVTVPSTGNPVTGPIDQARAVVGQQNSQLQYEEQRTGADDPTMP